VARLLDSELSGNSIIRWIQTHVLPRSPSEVSPWASDCLQAHRVYISERSTGNDTLVIF